MVLRKAEWHGDTGYGVQNATRQRKLRRHDKLLTVRSLAGGIFKLELFLPDDYPMTPPKIRFLTKIYHPNIDRLGRICLDVLKSKHTHHKTTVNPQTDIMQATGLPPSKSAPSSSQSKPC